MTESSSGLNELENRIQRRERSVRPPRKPRTDAAAPSGESPSQDLQKQIADAIAPVVDDLQRQIADIVRQQMQEAGAMSRQAAQPREAEVTEGAESHQTAGGEQSTQQDQKPEKSPLGTAIQKALAIVRHAFRWLANALRRAWQALMNGLRAFVVNVILGIAKLVLKALVRGLIHRLEGESQPKGTDSERPAAPGSSA